MSQQIAECKLGDPDEISTNESTIESIADMTEAAGSAIGSLANTTDTNVNIRDEAQFAGVNSTALMSGPSDEGDVSHGDECESGQDSLPMFEQLLSDVSITDKNQNRCIEKMYDNGNNCRAVCPAGVGESI